MLLAWLQLLRLPNVFTAAADVLMGYMFAQGSLADRPTLYALLGASCSLYLAGMVLNDVFDLPIDVIERPERPLPSGRISPNAARATGVSLLLLGVACGGAASVSSGQWRAGAVACLLAALVVLYDRWLKKTPLGPPAMGGCRMLNVLLGMSAAAAPWQAVHWLVAAGIGIYIAGVTWFARTEAQVSNRWQLALAVAVMAGGIGLLATLPMWSPDHQSVRFVDGRWYPLWGVLCLWVFWRCLAAIVNPTPRWVQAAVKQCILSLIMFDAATCFAARGQAALLIVILAVPAVLLGKFIYST